MSTPQLWVSAAEIGCFYALIALSYYLVLIGSDFFNFAIGPYAMVAGLATSWLVIEKGFGLWEAVGLSVLLTVALAVATELVVVRPVQRRSGSGELPALVAVAGVLFAIQQLAGVAFGLRTLPGQRLVTFGALTWGSATIQPNTVLLVGFTAMAFVATALWVRLSRTGRLLRAVGDSTSAARLLGLPVNRVRVVAFAVAGVLAAAAGLLFSPKAGVSSGSGLEWALHGFLALVIGGTGSVWAPLIGGLLLGGAQVFIPFYFGGAALSYVLLAVAMAFFAFKPEGLYTRRVRA
jgi:branched-chain amino acid transport system permease protein